jgi:hypothetical protein
MKNRETTVDEMLTHPHWCYSVPPYQRPYEWDISQWHGLVHDVLVAATQERPHWIGIFLTAEAADKCPKYGQGGSHICWEIIDGQQRLVTLRLIIKALQDHQKQFLPDEGGRISVELNDFHAQSFDQKEINEVLTGRWVQRQNLPIRPSSRDGALSAYLYFRWLFWLGEDAVLSEEPIPFPLTSRKKIHESMTFWEKWELAITEAAVKNKNFESNPLHRSNPINALQLVDSTLKKLNLLELRHDPVIDETPDVVFSSLNGKRMSLGQFDHVRNFVFTNCNPNVRSSTYENVWRPAEERVKAQVFTSSRAPNLETFLYDYLISRGEAGPQKGINRARSASQFSTYWRSGRHGFSTSEKLDKFIEDQFAPIMSMWVAAKSGSNIEISGQMPIELSAVQKRMILRTDAMSAGPFTPIILGVLTDFYFNNQSAEWLTSRLRAIEGFAARHLMLGTDLSPFRSKTMQIAAQCFGKTPIDLLTYFGEHSPKDSDVRSSIENFYRRDPSSGDEDFGKRLNTVQICALFDGMEQCLSESVSTHIVSTSQSKDDGFTIEHIYPQSASKWTGDLKLWGVNADRAHLMSARVHELGNITVLPPGPNSKISNLPFVEKKNKLKSLNRPALNVDTSWLEQKRWTMDEIGVRTRLLVDIALKQWPLSE